MTKQDIAILMFEVFKNDYRLTPGMIDNYDIAIAAVKKTMPKKPGISSYDIGFCPECHGSLWQNKDESHYCFRCGQALDWRTP